MAKPSRRGLRSQTAVGQSRSPAQDSSSDSSIPNTTAPARKASMTATLRAKRRPSGNPEQPPPKRTRRLDAKFPKARPSRDGEDGPGPGEDVIVNPAVLDALNNGPFNSSSRPVRQHGSGIAGGIPRSSKTSKQPRNRKRPHSAGWIALDSIEESPPPPSRQRDVAIDSVEREEPDESESDHAQHFQDRAAEEEEDNEVEHGSEDEDGDENEYRHYDEVEAEDGHRESPFATPAPRTINGLSRQHNPPRRREEFDVEDEDFGYGRSAQPRMASHGRVSLSPVTPGIQSIFTAVIGTRRLKAMVRLMGKPGWTGNGKNWEKGFSQGEPGITRIGKQLFKYLHSFRTLIRKNLPKLIGAQDRDLAKQKNWFDTDHATIQKSVSEIAKLVAKIREEAEPPKSTTNLGAGELERREAVTRDLLNPIIPQLVRVLGSLFSLGGVDSENHQILEEVIIIPEVLHYIQAVTRWISSLWVKLKWELEVRPLKNRHVNGTQLERLVKEQSSAWRLFEGAMNELRGDLEDAENQFEKANNEENEEERLVECSQRDEMIREAKKREEVEEIAAKQRQYEAVARSTHRIKSLERPMARMWRKAEESERHHRAPSVQFLHPTPSLGPFMSGARGPPPPQSHGPPVTSNHTVLGHEERDWLLNQIRKVNGEGRTERPSRSRIEEWAEILELEEDGLLVEAAALQYATRDLARVRGLPTPEWAREDWFVAGGGNSR